MKTSTWFAGCAVAALVCTGALAQEQQKRGSEGGAQNTPQQETQQGAPQRQQKGAETPAPKGQAQGQTQQHNSQRSDSGAKPTEPNKQAEQKKSQDQQPAQKGAQSKDLPNAPKNAEAPKQDTSKSAETPRTDRQGTADSKSGTSTTSGKGAVQLSEKQRTDVHRDILKEKNVNRVNVNVQVRVGEHVPRNVKLAPLPASIVTIVPAYRSYRYFVVDDRVVIIDPARYEIVEVIQPTGQVAGATQHLTLTTQERDVVIREIDMNGSRSTLGIGALSEGADVPRSVELMEFPAVVIEKVSKLRGYKYFVAEQRVAIVEPAGAKIALVIDEKH